MAEKLYIRQEAQDGGTRMQKTLALACQLREACTGLSLLASHILNSS